MIINDIIFNVDLATILTELKSQLVANGSTLLSQMNETTNDIMISCPYHKDGQEHKPSAGIRKTDGQFHCFTCGETHSLQEVISHCFGHEDMIGSFGWNWLLKNFLTVSIEHRKPLMLNYRRTAQNELKKAIVSEDELDSYRYTHPYMYKRKLNDEIIERFDIGYDKSKKCITFPVRDIDGDCLFIARRSVNTKYFNYPSGVEKPIYGLYELYQLDKFPTEIIICESMLDALVAWVWGKYAVALNGVGSFTQYKQLNQMPCRKFILATDNDSAGREARQKLRKYIKHKLISEYILPENKKDLNDLTEEEFNNLEEVY